jgi:CBS domain containing-hemolysin-like protein
MNKFKIIPSISVNSKDPLGVDDLAETLDLSSPATFVMTDFTRRSPLLIDQDASIDEALLIMRKTHSKTRIVVNEKMQMLGIVSSADAMSRKVLMSAHLKGVTRQDITVRDVMNDLNEVHGVKYNKVVKSSIGDVLETMRELGEQYLLVMDDNNFVRGLICASDIRRALRIPVEINTTAHSFKDVFSVIHGHRELA